MAEGVKMIYRKMWKMKREKNQNYFQEGFYKCFM